MNGDAARPPLPADASGAFGRANWGLVLSRATELAARRGRAPHELSKEDWEQAAMALTGDPGLTLPAGPPCDAPSNPSGPDCTPGGP